MWWHEVDFHLAVSAFSLGAMFTLMVVVLFWRDNDE